MKLASQKLNEVPQAGRDFTVVQVLFEREASLRLPDVNIEDLKMAWLTILQRASRIQHHKITREELSVRSHMTRILRLLQTEEFVEFSKLVHAGSRVCRCWWCPFSRCWSWPRKR